MFKEIYGKILEDNERSKVCPSTTSIEQNRIASARSQTPRNNTHRSSMPTSPVTNGVSKDELFLTAPPRQQLSPNGIPTRRASLSRDASPLPKRKPAIQPKPAYLRLQPLQPTDTSQFPRDSQDAIMERFARLRIQPSGEIERLSRARRDSTEFSSSSEDMPSSSASTARTQQDLYPEVPSVPPTKPAGPRAMPGMSAANPAVPPKIPLSPPVDGLQIQELPQPPKPAYDPSKTSIPAASNKSAIHGRRQSVNGIDEQALRSPRRESIQQNLPNGATLPTRSSSMQPPQNSIAASDLYSLFKGGNILLIDVRSRADFDSGHIYAQNVICIEPVGVRPRMSADELEERLINSPDTEQALFGQRAQFEYVVYYDQSTDNTNFIKGDPFRNEAVHLRAVYNSLYDFNEYKPLRRCPLVLLGGLNAWIDLVGSHALAASRTAILVHTQHVRRSNGISRKPVGRVASGHTNSSVEVRKRRLREQKPLDADEGQTWLEKAQSEEVNPIDIQRGHSDSDADDDNQEDAPPKYLRSTEEFLRAYPDVTATPQSMRLPITSRHAPPPSHPPPPPPVSAPRPPSMPPPAMQRPSYGGVIDRDSSQNTSLSRQTSAIQQPLYTSRSFSHYRKLPRTGLVNFGVTCYMNATIQCLLATIPLSMLFLDDAWRQSTVKNWKGSDGILPGYFANLIRSLWKDDDRPVRPSSLRSFLGRLKDEWGIDRQQDAKEFFDFIVDCLHEDMNRNFDRTPLRPLTDEEEGVRETWPIQRAAKVEWDRYLHREQSFISSLFAGQHASRLRCTTCSSTSTTYEPFYSISIEIPRSSPRRGMHDLHRCLQSYCQEERLAGEEVWRCPHCKREREATKQIILTRAPQFLVIHLKRFEVRKGDAKKVHTPINFPLHGLDIGEYMVRDGVPRPQYQSHDDPATSPPYVYDCYAVMRHIGNTGNGGHYISFVKDRVRNCWRKFDDEKVTEIDPAKLKGDKALQNEQAYLLFYGRSSPR